MISRIELEDLVKVVWKDWKRRFLTFFIVSLVLRLVGMSLIMGFDGDAYSHMLISNRMAYAIFHPDERKFLESILGFLLG